MRVLFLAPGVYDKGGISRYCRFQVRALRDRYGQQNVKLISKLGPDQDSFEEPIAVSWSGPPTTNLWTKIAFSLQAARLALMDCPEAVLTGHVNLGPLGRVVSWLSQAVLIQNVYGTEVWSGLSPLRRKALSNAESVISDCHNTAELAVSLGLRQEAPHVVWDCVDTSRYTPGLPDKTILGHYDISKTRRFRLMFLGRLTADARYKGTERCLRLLKTLPPGFECVVAGGGDDLDHLRGLAEQLDLADRTYFPGRIAEDHMPDVYRSADAFYLVSKFGHAQGEGLPLTPIEAMSCGVPAIVGDQDGSREILDGSGGICIRPGSEEPARDYLLRLDADPAFLAAERRAARLRIESAFEYERFAALTTRALERALRSLKDV